MPNGFPTFPKSTFPNDEPPTLFHPASPKMKPVKLPVDDSDNASVATASTFSSKVDLLKESVKSKIPASYRKYRDQKESAARSFVVSREEKRLPPDTKTRKSLPDYESRQRTAEAYMIWASIR
ncbi:hypothetical protein VTL71DRAFT_7081 [Oculimacula yallundae]|uniref:Uncharacterized protein n=1 Tax=Oculimacula yallundae TaxID=86028 RepID=A0ABR4BYA9_9HELO